tara:strand:+ start:1425 stop:2051 length:627 start_codon:yes stop_codon:yes gene_type:complete
VSYHTGRKSNGTTRMVTKSNEFRNRRTGQIVPVGTPYHMHPDKGPMEGATHNENIRGGTKGHDFFDRTNGRNQMPGHYGNRNGSMMGSNNTSRQRVRRNARQTTARSNVNRMPRRMGTSTMRQAPPRRMNPSMTRNSNGGRFIIAQGEGRNKQWLSCPTNIITSGCHNVTDTVNINNYSSGRNTVSQGHNSSMNTNRNMNRRTTRNRY